MKDESLVSVIIINYNGKSHLEKCLESLSKVNYNNFEIILVDNNSTDGSIEFVIKNYPSIIIIKLDENKGFAEPNNMATKIAKGDYFLFLNNDTIVDQKFISELVNVAQNDSKIAILQSLLLKPNGEVDSSGDFIDKIGVVYNSKKMPQELRKISSARGAAMMVRCEVFEKLHGFDSNFYVTFEDVDFGWRAWISGYKVVMVPTSIVYHFGGATIKEMKNEIAFHGLKNQLTMKITNFEGWRAVKSMVLFFITYGFRELRILLDYSFQGSTKITSTKYENKIAEKPSIKVIFNVFVWLSKNQKYIWKKRRSVNSLRVRDTKELERLGVVSNITNL